MLLFRIRAWDVENVPRRGGMLLVANHASFLDPPAVGIGLPRQVHFMARRTLFDVPLLGSLLHAIKAHPVERGTADLTAIRSGIALMRGGAGLVIFPEGTRSEDGRIHDFKPGFALMAARAGVPIVPAAILGSFEAWPKHRRLPRAAQVHVAYGVPMAPPADKRAACEAVTAEVQRRVAALYEALKSRP